MNAPSQAGMTRRGFITGFLAAGVCAVEKGLVIRYRHCMNRLVRQTENYLKLSKWFDISDVV